MVLKKKMQWEYNYLILTFNRDIIGKMKIYKCLYYGIDSAIRINYGLTRSPFNRARIIRDLRSIYKNIGKTILFRSPTYHSNSMLIFNICKIKFTLNFFFTRVARWILNIYHYLQILLLINYVGINWNKTVEISSPRKWLYLCIRAKRN